MFLIVDAVVLGVPCSKKTMLAFTMLVCTIYRGHMTSRLLRPLLTYMLVLTCVCLMEMCVCVQLGGK